MWSVIAIAPRPSASACSSSSSGATRQSCDAFVCMCRSTTIQSRSASGSDSRRALRLRVAALVDLLELVRDVGERLALRRRRAPRPRGCTRYASSSASRPISAAASCGCSCVPGGEATAAPAAAASSASREMPCVAGTKIAASLRIAARLGESRAVRTSTRSSSARGTYGRVVSGFVRSSVRRQSGKLAERVQRGARERPLGGAPLEHDQPLLLRRLEERRVDALRHDAVGAGEAGGCGVGRLLRHREQLVDPPEQPFALRASRRIREALGREERRDREALGVAKREVREARQRRARTRARRRSGRRASARERFVAHADGNAHAAAARDRHRRAEDEQPVAVEGAVVRARGVRRRDRRRGSTTR